MTTSWTASDALPGRPPAEGGRLWLVAGKDPLARNGGGHSAYVRMWGRAACAIGLVPRMVSVSPVAEVVETPFGTLHRVRSPFSRAKGLDAYRAGFRTHTILWHRALLTRALTRLVLTHSPANEPVVLHGFGIWAVCAVDAGRALRRRGRQVRILATVYSRTAHEYVAKWRGLGPRVGWRNYWRYGWDMLALSLGVDRMEGVICRGADEVLVNYESVCRLLAARWGTGIPFRRIAYTCEHVFATPTRDREGRGGAGPPRIVAVSRHDPRKGLDVLLQALAQLTREGAPYRATLVGTGPLLDSHRRLARDLGLAAQVDVVGFQEDALTPLRNADIFALPSLEESSGSLSLLEAMEQGKAIVASAVDGIPEDVRDGESALLVTPGDPTALAAALRRLLLDPALRARLGVAAGAEFERRFSRDGVLRDLQALYRPMARSSSSLPASS